eukprot:1788443-Alexandrium_andersonii.AAC.1
MSASLVGSEMCIRDRAGTLWCHMNGRSSRTGARPKTTVAHGDCHERSGCCLLYTSDAADDM